MLWKFPGSGGQQSDSTMEGLALWDERERIAKRLYSKASSHDLEEGSKTTAWDDLDEDARKPWLKQAHAQMGK